MPKSEKSIKEELKENSFRVSIFGSARIKGSEDSYKQTYELAKELGNMNIDVITGGGPGIMEAASKGHDAGSTNGKSDTIGLTIKLPFEQKNDYLDVNEHFEKFSGRLDHFMALSDLVVVMPGGVGTCLEFFYTWQLIQVKHICPIPVILIGDMWKKLMEWVIDYPVKDGLISKEDLNNIYYVSNNEQALKIIKKTHDIYLKEDGNYCKNIIKYKLDE